MAVSRRGFLKLGGAAVAGATMLGWLPPAIYAQSRLDNPHLHLLNRITWGVRPEDLARINSIGYEAYLEEQLNPYSLDDSLADARLRQFPLLNMGRKALYRLTSSEYRCHQAMIQAMITRAVYSNRQLLERMVDFWTDHFNAVSEEIYADMISYHRDAIRQHALGNFRDMLLATAKHPAMLYYLDNYLNVAEHPNENYARELLELHTLGVDGGYTEADVLAVARAFTGWTIHDGTRDGFYFDNEVHDTDPKTILGHQLPSGREIEDGLHVISIVANHPATAQFLSRKLCVRFVSDDPAQSLVDSTAQVWIQTQGEIVPVLRHIFTSQAFRQSVGQKLRRPLEFFIGAMRATGTEVTSFWRLEELLLQLAQPPYGWLPPNGYPDVAGAWMSSSGLLARWNVSMTLTHEALSTVDSFLRTDLHNRVGNPQTISELVDHVATQVYGMPLPAEMNAEFIAYASDDRSGATSVTSQLLSTKLGTLYGLMLASPAYQWR